MREYWLIDPRRKDATLYRLNVAGQFERADLNPRGEYQTPILPGLRIETSIFWEKMLPKLHVIVAQVQAMLAESDDNP